MINLPLIQSVLFYLAVNACHHAIDVTGCPAKFIAGWLAAEVHQPDFFILTTQHYYSL
jgi:hypothetical protein